MSTTFSPTTAPVREGILLVGDDKPFATSTPNPPSSDDSTPVAFNGGTFTRPNRKYRKGIGFIVNATSNNENQDGPISASRVEETGSKTEVPTQPSGSPSSGASSIIIPNLVLPTPESGGSSVSSRMKSSPMEELSIIEGGSGGDQSFGTNSLEENFECFVGEGESLGRYSFLASPDNNNIGGRRNSADIIARDNNLSEVGVCGVGLGEEGKRSSLTRNGWQRTSLRKTPTSGGGVGADGMATSTSNHRRWGSFRNSPGKRAMVGGGVVVPSTNALANQLYRSSSYHSSGRSSAGDGEEMYSDSSLEGEVIDLTKKVHHLEEKFTVLAENQHDVDDRFTRSKQENAELKTKLFMLEEQLRDVELRSEEKMKEETRRHKDTTGRMEREKLLQLENLEIKLQMLEKELSSAKIETKRLEGSLERERNENNYLSDKLTGTEREVGCLREENRELLAQNRMDRESMVQESVGSQQALVELKAQLESLSHFHMNGGGGGSSNHFLRRNDSSDPAELRSRLIEAEDEIKRLKLENNQLQEINEELNAQMLNQRLEDGRNLLKTINCVSSSSGGNSLAAEFEAMSNEEMRTALKDQKEANVALRAYIDNILLNIVEHYPQLLEVKHSTKERKFSGNGIVNSR